MYAYIISCYTACVCVSVCSKNVFMGETDNTTLPVQTPAVDFTITNDSVSM